MLKFLEKDTYPKVLFILFTLFWILIAIAPRYRVVWIAESVPTVLLGIFLVFTYKNFRFSNWSYSLIFFFLILHTIGSYYSYSEMPLFDLLKELFDLSRNHYDRLVHFFYGFVFFFPIQEFLMQRFKMKGMWSAIFAFFTVASIGAIYELIEYFVLFFVESGIVGSNYLGMQGDIFDAQKDMALDIFGAVLAWLFALFELKH